MMSSGDNDDTLLAALPTVYSVALRLRRAGEVVDFSAMASQRCEKLASRFSTNAAMPSV